MDKQETKQALLQIGTKLMLRQGYNHTGLNDVLNAAGIPKGSFYYYFESKEDFALQVLEHFAEQGNARRAVFFNDKTLDPLSRLRGYFEWYMRYLEAAECSMGCLVGNFGQEMADQNEKFRLDVLERMTLIADDVAACLLEAQQTGQISASLDVKATADFFYNSWQGSMLRMKVTKSIEPLQTFLDMVFGIILKP